MSLSDWTRVVALSILFGASFFLTEIALTGFSPWLIVLTRLVLAALALLAVCRATGRALPRDRRIWAGLAVMGVLNNALPFCLIAGGQVFITGAMTSVLIATTPIFTVLLAHVLTRDERLSWHKLFGVLLGVVGVAILLGPEFGNGPGTELIGQVAILGAALSYALAAIFGRRFHGMDPVVASAGMVVCSSVLMMPVVAVFEVEWTDRATYLSVMAIVTMAVLSTAVAYLLYFKILASAGATNLMLVTLLVPVSATALGVVFIGEPVTAAMAAGAVLIFAGLAAIDGRVLSVLKQRSRI